MTDKFLKDLIKKRDDLNNVMHSVPSYPSIDQFARLGELDRLIEDYKKQYPQAKI